MNGIKGVVNIQIDYYFTYRQCCTVEGQSYTVAYSEYLRIIKAKHNTLVIMIGKN